jgi:hypothetical protein
VYDEPDDTVILVLHGSRVRTVAFWQGADIVVNPFRFARDDVLIYDKARAILSVKVSTMADRERYVRSFAGLILGDASLADDPTRDRIFTLKPLQVSSSELAGNGRVSAVELRKAKLKLSTTGSETRTIEGNGLGLTKADLSCGELVEVKLRLTLTAGGRDDKVTFTIEPPCLTDVVKKRHAEAIADYLRGKGVLLR